MKMHQKAFIETNLTLDKINVQILKVMVDFEISIKCGSP